MQEKNGQGAANIEQASTIHQNDLLPEWHLSAAGPTYQVTAYLLPTATCYSIGAGTSAVSTGFLPSFEKKWGIHFLASLVKQLCTQYGALPVANNNMGLSYKGSWGLCSLACSLGL